MMNSRKAAHQKKLSAFIAPPALLNKAERIAVLVLLAYIILPLLFKHQCKFDRLPLSSIRRLKELKENHSQDSALTLEIYKRLKKSGLIGQYPFLAALTAPQIQVVERQKYNDWLALILLSCLQLFILEDHDSAIKDALRQIRLIAINAHHQNLLTRLPCISDFQTLNECIDWLEPLRQQLKEESQFDQRHFKGLCFLHVAVKDAVDLKAGVLRPPKNNAQRDVKAEIKAVDKFEDQLLRLNLVVEPVTKQQKDEDLAVQKTQIFRNNTKSKPHQSLTFKAYQAKKLVKQFKLRELSLPCDPDELTEHDAEYLARYCIEYIDGNDLVGWLFLSLLSGRTVEFLYDRNLRDSIFHSNNGNPYLRLTHQVPASKQPKELKKILPDTTPFLFIPLPLGFAQWIAQEHSAPNTEQINSIIQKINKKHRVRLSVNKIASYLEHILLSQGVDDMVISLLRNEDHRAKPSLSYGTISLYSPLSCHNEFTKHIFNLAEKKLVLSPDLSCQGEYTGSRLFIDDNVCKKLFAVIANSLKESKNCWLFHNQYLVYVWSILAFSSGHRDVDAPFGKLSDYNADNGTLWISDKECRSSQCSRMILLPKTAQKQISFYMEHLNVLIKEAKFTEPDVEQRCIDALNGKQNLLFAIVQKGNKLETIDLTPSILDKLFNFPLPHNWPRHYFRSLFCEKKISSELSNAWMGHVDHGMDGFSQFSCLSIATLKKLSAVIESKMNKLGMEAIKGWLTR